MKLYKRNLTSNIYKIGCSKFKSIIGGVPNVLDDHSNFTPLDNELKIITSHPIVKYVIKQNWFFIGFHNKNTNKYLSVVKLKSGESMTITAINDIAVTPTIIDKHIIQWKYPNGSWIREYVTEKKIKEVVKQKAGQVIKFKYQFTGLTVKNEQNQFIIMRGNKKAFTIKKPYYCTSQGDFISYVPITWEKVLGNWEVTYPPSSSDCFIDPTIVFGYGSGHVGSGHEDTWIRSDDKDEARGSSVILSHRGSGVAIKRWALIKFDLSLLPSNAVIISATLTYTVVSRSEITDINLHELKTFFFAGTGDPAEPPVGENDASTWSHSRYVTSVLWAIGDIGSNDFGDLLDTQVFPASGTIVFDIKTNIEEYLTDTSDNKFGTTVQFISSLDAPSGAGVNSVNSLDSITPSNRPYLTIDYEIPGAIIHRRREFIKGRF